MQHNEQDELKVLAEQIMRYLDRHPDAADSVEGIVSWWLPEQRYIESMDHVFQALDYLIKKGEINRKELADGHIIFGKQFENNSR